LNVHKDRELPVAIRIGAFGDSFVNGTGDDDCLGWVGRLCSTERRSGVDVTLYNLGVRRDTSADVRSRWRREAGARLSENEGGRLLFSFGLNDCAKGEQGFGPRVSPAQTLENAEAILLEASAWLPTLMIGPLPVTDSDRRNKQVIALSAELQNLSEELGVPFFSTVHFAALAAEGWRAEASLGDGIHPNANSYAALAKMIGAWSAWQSWRDAV
jgi:acyl-CoA thioesterase-1